MNTQDLITLLASGAGAAPRFLPGRRMAPAIAGGLFVAALLSIGLLGLVPVPMFGSPALWTKLGYAMLLAAGAGWLAARLARPLAHTKGPAALIAGALGAMALLGLLNLLAQAPDERMNALLGSTWYRCPWIILAISLPALAALLGTLRTLAPTRLREAGLAAGLLAGALGAIGYSLHCPEVSPAFIAVWYSLGIFATGAFGALLGPVVLRW